MEILKNTPFRQDLMFHLDKVFPYYTPLRFNASKGVITFIQSNNNYKHSFIAFLLNSKK